MASPGRVSLARLVPWPQRRSWRANVCPVARPVGAPRCHRTHLGEEDKERHSTSVALRIANDVKLRRQLIFYATHRLVDGCIGEQSRFGGGKLQDEQDGGWPGIAVVIAKKCADRTSMREHTHAKQSGAGLPERHRHATRRRMPDRLVPSLLGRGEEAPGVGLRDQLHVRTGGCRRRRERKQRSDDRTEHASLRDPGTDRAPASRRDLARPLCREARCRRAVRHDSRQTMPPMDWSSHALSARAPRVRLAATPLSVRPRDEFVAVPMVRPSSDHDRRTSLPSTYLPVYASEPPRG